MMNIDINIEEARIFQHKKHAKQLNEYKLLQKKATKDFNLIVKMIIEKYNPKRIYQWGSLLQKDSFTDFSDIDIAIEGINDANVFFNLLADAENLTDYPLDIIEIEKIHILHKNMVLEKGKLIYERFEK